MSSRKKAQGQARKAASAPRYGSLTCTHLAPSDDYTVEDWAECKSLLSMFEGVVKVYHDYEKRFGNVRKVSAKKFLPMIWLLKEQTYSKYSQFSDSQQQLFRALVAGRATEFALADANKYIELDGHVIERGVQYVMLLNYIEVRDDNGGGKDIVQTCKNLTDFMHNSREKVRFIHKRNGCSCLDEVYSKLKKNLKRTTFCRKCFVEGGPDVMKVCTRCNVVVYCSKSCQIADWAEHKISCNMARDDQINRSGGEKKKK